jgi:hypothetical protein
VKVGRSSDLKHIFSAVSIIHSPCACRPGRKRVLHGFYAGSCPGRHTYVSASTAALFPAALAGRA